MTASYHLFMKGVSRGAVAGMVQKHVQGAMSWVLALAFAETRDQPAPSSVSRR